MKDEGLNSGAKGLRDLFFYFHTNIDKAAQLPFWNF
jgi:hypothetical protein